MKNENIKRTLIMSYNTFKKVDSVSTPGGV